MKFCGRDFSLGDAPWSDRLVEVDSDQIETLLENNQRYTTWETAKLKISKPIKLLVKMKKCVFYFTVKTMWLFGKPNTLYFNDNLSSAYSLFDLSLSVEHLICFQFVAVVMLINIFMQEAFSLSNCLIEINPQI